MWCMEALSWRWIYLSVLTIGVHFKHFLNENIWQANFVKVLSKWMWLLQWPKFNFVILLSEPSAQAEAIILNGFLPGVKFLFALCCQKDNFTDRRNYIFFLRAEQIVNLQPQGSAVCMGCQIISVCQISVSQLNPSVLNRMVILFYFLPLILSNALPDGGICFE